MESWKLGRALEGCKELEGFVHVNLGKQEELGVGEEVFGDGEGENPWGCERNLMVATTVEATMTIAMGKMRNVVVSTTTMTVATIIIVVVTNVVGASIEYAEDMCVKV